jgi:hypothetical protein
LFSTPKRHQSDSGEAITFGHGRDHDHDRDPWEPTSHHDRDDREPTPHRDQLTWREYSQQQSHHQKNFLKIRAP